MYFVDTNQLKQTLLIFDQLLETSHKVDVTKQLDKLSLERIAHLMIESVLDVGNMMIDGFIMRDPGSYIDIIDVLVDEHVLPEHEREGYIALISLRKMLVNHYHNVDHQKLWQTIHGYRETFSQFSQHILTYLANETGVANTFIDR
ncbi:hypothetical protein J416_13434 [Gracilibacillus halophilus YIM-C55.5]|uniref:DUF86 domain-containing protein n=1 Tax=Gracilibacillus halophilus YIM-C55.5 TaxID=1308866 RepID=N4W9J2_9BACI|nr:DUF86 domain-containing protein [Gracilibacillus halophilus]ENH95929.1 hypothetical protein J416_13434 [Gracilibacillus halophilus YIM-C55.5]